MKKGLKRFLFGLTTAAMIFTTTGNDLQATLPGAGFGYMDGVSASNITPEMAFLGLLILSIIIVSLQNDSGGSTQHAHTG